MPQYLIMKLDGPMQAWGRHTFEDFRPSHPFPTRSGIIGLIAACLGIDRDDITAQKDLAESMVLTVREDKLAQRSELGNKEYRRHTVNMVDFHTVLDARKVDGKPNPNPVVSRREYLYDACFTVVLKVNEKAHFSLDEIAKALQRPVYTPVLGRRSCPLARPLFEKIVESSTAMAALRSSQPHWGTIYTEEQEIGNGIPMSVRDVPMHQRNRKFANRVLYVVNEGEEK